MKAMAWALATALVAAGLALNGCGKEEGASPTTQTTQAASSGKKVKLAFVTNNAADFWTIARKGCLKAEEELKPNVSVEFQIPSDATAATQKRILDDLLAKGVQGIAVSPVDPANQTEELNYVAGKALLFTQDSDAPESNRVCYLGTDNFAAGRQAGVLIKEALPEGGKIMVFVGNLGAQNAKDRLGGITEVLKGSKVEIIDCRTDNTDISQAKRNAADTIVKYPDVACLVGLWNYNGPAILNAVQDAKMVGEIKIVCFDENEETLRGVQEGAIYATVVQQPFEFGHQAVTLMNKYLGGDKSAIPANKQIIIPTLIIKKDSVDAFWTRLKALLGQ